MEVRNLLMSTRILTGPFLLNDFIIELFTDLDPDVEICYYADYIYHHVIRGYLQESEHYI